MRILAVIPARGGSKGLPGKNTMPLAGIPLIGHSIAFARLIPEVERTIVTTDDPSIAEVARALGGDVPFLRPAELATDRTPMAPVVRHALLTVEEGESEPYDAVLLLDPTSPVRDRAAVCEAIRKLADTPGIDGVISVSAPRFDPLWVGVEVTEPGTLRRFFSEARGVTRRQDAARQYLRINGSFYLWTSEFARRLGTSWFDEGTFAPLVIPESQAYSIDDSDEFQLIEVLLEQGVLRLPVGPKS